MPSLKRYNNKSRFSPYTKSNIKSRNYRKYYYKQPKSTAFVEEPTDSEQESEASDSEIDEFDEGYQYQLNENDSDREIYDIYQNDDGIDSNSDSDSDSDSDSEQESGEVYDIYEVNSDVDSLGNTYYYPVDSEDEVIIDLNDELQNDAVEYMIDSGDIEDINDQLVRFYDDDEEEVASCSDSECEECEDECDDSECEECDESCDDSECEECDESCDDSDLDEENLDRILTVLDDNNVFERELSDEELIDEDAVIENMSEHELFDEVFGDFMEADDDETSSSDSDSDSDSDSSDASSITEEIEFSPDIEQLNDQLKLENVRLYFQDDLDKVNALSSDEESDSDSDADDELKYIEAGKYYDSDDESTDDEGITIYRHRFDMPEYESDQDSTDEELMAIDSESDCEDEDCQGCQVIDLSDELADSKDFECQEFDDYYKINIRLPSINQEELKIDFSKNQNELIINGKFDFNIDEVAYLDEEDVEEIIEDDHEEFSEEEEDEEEEVEEVEEENEEDKDDDEEIEDAEEEVIAEEIDEADEDIEEIENKQDDEIEENPMAEAHSESESDDDYADSYAEDEDFSGFIDEEMLEEAENLIYDFENHEISFEKHFTFDKIVKFNEIKAKFINEDELEIIVPREDIDVETDDLITITIDKQNLLEAAEEQEAEQEEEQEEEEQEEAFEDASLV